MRPTSHRLAAPLIALAALLGAVACSSSSSPDASGDTSSSVATTAAPQVLHIMVTNDDGVGAPGIDALVEALRQLPDTEVTVVAPADDKSSTGATTTDGPLTTSASATASGYPATAVDGYPVDTVIWALDQGGLDQKPDLVIAGINKGQNLGPGVPVSGTVNAAKAAAARGVPALAVSQGRADTPDYASGVQQVLAWIDQRRAELVGGTASTPAEVDNLNVPTCPIGSVRGLVVLPVAPELGDRNVLEVDCTSTATGQTDDVDGFTAGFAVLSLDIGAG